MSSTNDTNPTTTNGLNDGTDQSAQQPQSILLRSWHAILSPFSQSALASLPNLRRPARYVRADDIPETQTDEEGHRPTVRDYHSINSVPPQVRIPAKMPTPVKVEGKVWFANERTWVSWLNMSILLAALAVALFNASKDDVSQYFAYFYALVSVCVLVYGYVLYQYRISMIRRRDPGHFDALAGPVLLSIVLFFAVLANFIIRVRELQRKEYPIPGSDLVKFFIKSAINSTVASQSYSTQKQL